METDAAGRPWIERVVASRPIRSLYASLLTHAAVFLLLAALVRQSPAPPRPLLLTLSFARAAEHPADQPVAIGTAAAADGESQGEPEPAARPLAAAGQGPGATANTALAPAASTAAEPNGPGRPTGGEAPPAFETDGSGGDQTSPPEASADAGDNQRPGSAAGSANARRLPLGRGAYAGRRGEGRQRGLAAHGGSAASEAAVAGGLAWLARHQADDGSWRFDLSGCRCDGACRHRGTVTSTTAATGIALLPFLGAGHTHEDGSHRETVTRGLYYLMSRMRATPRGGDLSEGTMYGHGVATLALAEAFGMTTDRMLLPYVRDAVRFTETAQDLHGGGWRYLPGQPGDTTVTAWQLAALKSAALAGVAVPSPTIDGVCRFLDRVSVRDGEGYGYLSPQDRGCTSAIGLLCRVYTAWPEEATIDRGLARLARRGPDREAVYQNFYLAQALLLRRHPAWDRWNKRNRDTLVARQDRIGHEAGSWAFADPDTAPGGRLGHTALAILTLEVYYRLLPIYSPDAAEMRW